MASLLWTSVFGFLVIELVLTMILVLPVPRKIRNYMARKVSKLKLGESLSKPILFIALALFFALVESYVSHRRIVDKMEALSSAAITESPTSTIHHNYDHHQHSHHDRQRKYKSERNMYLTGFALTLLFVIGRITQLMQESVELEEELERVRLTSKPPAVDSAAISDDDKDDEHNDGNGVEMKTIRKPKSASEKKNE